MSHQDAQARIMAYISQQLSSETEAMILQVEGQQIPLEGLDEAWLVGADASAAKPVTLRAVLQYYTSVAPFLLSFLRDRPLTIRYVLPDGQGRLERYCRRELPTFVETATIFHDATNDNERVVLVQNFATLLWLVSQGGIEFYPWLSRITPEPGLPNIFINSSGTLDLSVLSYPDYLVLHLDPPLLLTPVYQEPSLFSYNPDLIKTEPSMSPAIGILIKAAEAIHHTAEELGLTALPQLDGKGGLQILIPIHRNHTFTQVRQAAKALRERAILTSPNLLTSEWQFSERHGKVFVQIDENGRGKLVAAPFSLQMSDELLVARPCQWEELPTLSSLQLTLAEAITANYDAQPSSWHEPARQAKDIPEVLRPTSE